MGAFTNSTNQQSVSLSSLPAPIRDRVLAWMAPEFPPGVTDADKQKAYEESKTNKERVVATPDGGREIRDFAGIPGTILKFKVVDKATGQVQISAERKAFQIDLDKEDFLPGIYSMGGPTFENEQELHGFETVRPWKIKDAHAASSLKEEFPVTTSTSAPAPTMPSDGGGIGFAEGGAEVEAEGRGEVGAPTPPAADTATPATTGATVDFDTEWNAADGSGTKRANIGVGEKVYFTADTDGAWSAPSGTRTGTGQTFDWIAPGTAGAARSS